MMMRVIFLGSAYFGYVYTYAFDHSALGDLAYAIAEQEWHDRVGSQEARPAPKHGESWLERLAARVSRRKEQATC
jgi:hypothetical protein